MCNNVRIKQRLTIGLIVSTSVMIIFMIFVSIIDGQTQKHNITIWENTKPRNPDPEYCETYFNTTSNTTNYRYLKEKFNAISSLSFLVPSLLPFFFFAFDAKNGCVTDYTKLNKYKITIMARYPTFSFLTSVISIFHVTGTFTNHACSCLVGLILDNIFQWLMLGLPILFTTFIYSDGFIKSRTRFFYINWTLVYILYSILMIVLAVMNLKIIYQTIITVGLVLILIISNIIGISSNKKVIGTKLFFWLSLICATIGLIFAFIDGLVCDKTRLIGAPGTHFLWHIFGSIALTFLYIYQWTMKEDFNYIRSMI